MQFTKKSVGQEIRGCLKEYGNPEVLIWAVKMRRSMEEKLSVLLIAILVMSVVPFISITVYALASIPVGLYLLNILSQLQFDLFTLLSGFVVGGWVLMVAFVMKKWMQVHIQAAKRVQQTYS
jgi:hypothetical protein